MSRIILNFFDKLTTIFFHNESISYDQKPNHCFDIRYSYVSKINK